MRASSRLADGWRWVRRSQARSGQRQLVRQNRRTRQVWRRVVRNPYGNARSLQGTEAALRSTRWLDAGAAHAMGPQC